MGVVAAIIGAVGSAAGGIGAGMAEDTASRYEQQQYDQNSQMAEMQAQDALERGDKEAANVRRRAALMQGSQRASMAAQGLSLADGTAADILTETAEMGVEDAMTVKNNAYREAWGLRREALNLRVKGKMRRHAGRFSSNMTYLTGGLSSAKYGAEAYGESQKGKTSGSSSGSGGGGQTVSGGSYMRTDNIS